MERIADSHELEQVRRGRRCPDPARARPGPQAGLRIGPVRVRGGRADAGDQELEAGRTGQEHAAVFAQAVREEVARHRVRGRVRDQRVGGAGREGRGREVPRATRPRRRGSTRRSARDTGRRPGRTRAAPPVQASDSAASVEPGEALPGRIVPPASSAMPAPACHRRRASRRCRPSRPPGRHAAVHAQDAAGDGHAPVKLLAPVSASVPGPALVKPPAPTPAPRQRDVVRQVGRVGGLDRHVAARGKGDGHRCGPVRSSRRAMPALKLRFVAKVPVPFRTMPPAPR